MINIEKGVPLPTSRARSKKPPSKYGFMRNMVPGDSAFFPAKEWKEHPVRSAVYLLGKAEGWKMRVAKVEGGVRVWRVE